MIRREFLQRLATSAAALALDPFRGVAVEGDVWSNARLGLSVAKPPGWVFSSIADFSALRDRQVIEGEALGPDPHPLKDPGNLPVLLIEGPAHRRGGFAPGVALYDEPQEADHTGPELGFHARVLRGFSTVYRDVRVLEAPRERILNGIGATESRWRYVHVLDDGTTHAMVVQTVLVFRPPRIHTFYLVDQATDPVVPRALQDAIVDSIRYAG